MSLDLATLNCGIYQIRNSVNGKRYIGSSKNIKRRFYLHKYGLARKNHHSKTLQRSWEKYGESAFEFKTLMVCSEDNLFFYEQLILDGYKSFDPSNGYNICSEVRGTHGIKWTDDQREKMIKAKTGKSIFKNNPVAHANLVASKRRGSDHPMFGRKHSQEAIQKISDSLRGRIAHNKGKTSPLKGVKRTANGYRHSAETIEKIRIASVNQSPESREKRAVLFRNPSDETRAKLSASTSAYWERKRAIHG
jgi:group I intron endonuclease